MTEPTIPETAIAQIERIAHDFAPSFAVLTDDQLVMALKGFHSDAFGLRVPTACGRAYALMLEAARRLERNNGEAA